MAINLYQTAAGLKIVSDNSEVVYSSYSYKRNNLSANKLTIIDGLPDNYDDYELDFTKQAIYYNTESIANAETLANLLDDVSGVGFIDYNNSTETALSANDNFTGTAIRTPNAAIIYTSVATDVAGTLIAQQSIDNVNWDFTDSYNVKAGAAKTYSFQAAVEYFRIYYLNGGSDQAYFRLQTCVKNTYGKPSSHRIQDTIKDDDDGELTLNVVKLRTAQDDYVSQSATTSGNAKMSLEELESGISTNENAQLNVSSFIIDEYSNYNHQLGDNAFKGAIIAISPEHHEIHCGDSYTAHHVADLGNGASINYLITTPDWGDPVSGDDPFGNQGIKVSHFIGEIQGEAETQVFFYESPTVTGAGTALNVRNRNRNSSNTDYLTITYGGTVSANGTELEHSQFGSGKVIGGGINRTDEWVLKNNTTYLIIVTNNTTSDNYHTIRFQYYVHAGI